MHIHSKDGSDGRWSLDQIFKEAHTRNIHWISITDHDNILCQGQAKKLASHYRMVFVSGVELNISFSHPGYKGGKGISLDLLGYGFDFNDKPFLERLQALQEHRKVRARRILDNLNRELFRNRMNPLTNEDFIAIEATVDGSFGRPHIASYMVKKGLVRNRQEAFERYLVGCDVPKMPFSLKEASSLVRGAGGLLFLAHFNDPNGTSLATITHSLEEQFQIIRDSMLPFLDGIECWHTRHSTETVAACLFFAQNQRLLVSGGSDCHQDPAIMGSVSVPQYAAEMLQRKVSIT